jgi:hypothetical protein
MWDQHVGGDGQMTLMFDLLAVSAISPSSLSCGSISPSPEKILHLVAIKALVVLEPVEVVA